jgi:hypothetical protein
MHSSNFSHRLNLYGITNRYKPVTNIKKSGGSGEYVIQEEGSVEFAALAIKLATTVTVKMIDNQRCPCRIQRFQRIFSSLN